MAENLFKIPDEYKSELRYVESKDKHTDAEILISLTKRAPITSEKNIWTYWHAGIHAMPTWCKRNLISWVRIHGSDWTVRVLDTVPNSSNHALKWIDPKVLPEAFVKGTMTGPYAGPHSADFLRGAALFAYGGAWMDVGIFLFRNLENVCWDQLADDNNPYNISTPWMFEQYTANHFVAARKGDVFIQKWHELFVHLWKGQADYTGVIQSPLIAFMKDFKFSQAKAQGFDWDFKVDELTLMGYIGQVVAWMRLTWLQEPEGGFDGVEYWATRVLLFDSGPEAWAAEQIVGYKGEDLFKVFTTRIDADPESEEYKLAKKTAWRLLTKSSFQKITHGKHLTHPMHCGAILDLPESEGKDQEPGTFGELIRYGSVHLEQTRQGVVYVDPVVVGPELVIHKGLLEA